MKEYTSIARIKSNKKEIFIIPAPLPPKEIKTARINGKQYTVKAVEKSAADHQDLIIITV